VIEETPDYPALLSLAGKHIIVLGGGPGIARQTCIAAASVGAKVSVVDIDPDCARASAQEVGGLALGGDATNRDDVERVIAEAVDRFGPLHGLADIVGMSTWVPLVDTSEDVWQHGIDVNLRHVFLALQVASKAMTDGGSMVFVGSISGLRSAPGHSIYGAAKAALANLVASAAVELGPRIRVNSVAPGQTATPLVKSRHPEPDYFENAGKEVPLGRVGMPRDIAAAILFLLTDLSQWMTGQTIVLDGGTGKKFQYNM
jgi:NAD(P)-dependent dehydrogenase (short-subunit alcohol dehydrogenase family)